MTWPFKAPENTPNPEVGGDNAASKQKEGGEPDPAKLIADSLATALKPISDAIAAQNDRFAKLEEQTKPREVKAVVNPQEPISVLDDENAAFAQRMTPILARQLELEARVVRGDIKTEYAREGFGDLWSQYEGDINQILDNSPLAGGDGKIMRGDPQYIRNVVDMVLGRAARKAGMKFNGKDKSFFLETGGSGSEHADDKAGDGLTDAQRKVLGRMGIPLDKAKATMSKLVMVT